MALSEVISSRSLLLPYLEEIRGTFSGFGITWEQWLKLWPHVRLAGLPGYPYWERQVFQALSENLGVLLRVFSFHAKRTMCRILTTSAAGTLPSVSRTLVLGKMEWIAFVKECKLFSKKLGNERTMRQLTLNPSPGALVSFPEFLAALVKLAFWRANAFLEEGNTEQIEVARREFRVRGLAECFVAALQNHVLPLAQRDSSQRFRARLAQDDGVQMLMRDYKDQLQETFMQLTSEAGDDTALECATALGWLEQCGVLGHSAVRTSANGLDPAKTKTVFAALSIEQATDAFVAALPAISCLGPQILEAEGAAAAQLTALRHFQEWLARCGEIKYGGIGHVTVADRTAGILQNVFERRSTEDVILEAMTPASVERFNPEDWPPPEDMSRSELFILSEAWKHVDLSSLPGHPVFEQSVFELLAQCVAPLIGIFGYYSRSSLEQQAAESAGFVELAGWNDFIIDCNAITKSFSGLRAAEVCSSAPPASILTAMPCPNRSNPHSERCARARCVCAAFYGGPKATRWALLC